MKPTQKITNIKTDIRNSDKEIDLREERFIHRFEAEKKIMQNKPQIDGFLKARKSNL